MKWVGIFPAPTWTVTLIGVYVLLADARRGDSLPSPTTFTSPLVLGRGLFNLVEGLIDHHILNLHHVRDLPAHVPIYDWAFVLVAGLGFIAAGWAISSRNEVTTH